MADEKKENDKPENESELTMHHIVSDGKARTEGEGAEVFGFEPQPLNSAAAGQDEEKESGTEDSKEKMAERSKSTDQHHLLVDGWSAKK